MHFTPSEFTCTCGCLESRTKHHFIQRLETARTIANIPFVITSGYRCPSHNKAVGGSASSSHLLGLAADIMANSSSTRYVIISALIGAGFRRIGIAKTFIHVDYDLSKPASVIWTY